LIGKRYREGGMSERREVTIFSKLISVDIKLCSEILNSGVCDSERDGNVEVGGDIEVEGRS
jgi:hypothetical protein